MRLPLPRDNALFIRRTHTRNGTRRYRFIFRLTLIIRLVCRLCIIIWNRVGFFNRWGGFLGFAMGGVRSAAGFLNCVCGRVVESGR